MWYAFLMAGPMWKKELAGSVTRESELRDALSLTAGEEGYFAATDRGSRLGVRITPEIMSMLVSPGAGIDPAARGALRRQFVPTADELRTAAAERNDPLGEGAHSPLPRLIHRYPDRALLLVTDQCAVHCRHCFRSRFTGGGRGAISSPEIAEVAAYLAGHEEIRELILSGGDALMMTDGLLEKVFKLARDVRPEIVFRLATRLPVVLPSRVTDLLVGTLAAARPLWVVLQVNHAAELTDRARGSIRKLAGAGIPILNQAVLLRGVNDSVQCLAELFTELVRLQVKPYYLFQGDLAPGTAHLRVNLARAQSIVKELRGRVSGLAMPVFAVDIPGGGGKVLLEESALAAEDSSGYQLRAADGSLHPYPREGAALSEPGRELRREAEQGMVTPYE